MDELILFRQGILFALPDRKPKAFKGDRSEAVFDPKRPVAQTVRVATRNVSTFSKHGRYVPGRTLHTPIDAGY